MKRLIVLLATLLLSFGLISAENRVDVTLSGAGFDNDTIRIGMPVTYDVALENDELLGGLSLGFTFTSPDGVDFAWNNVGGLDPTNGMFTVPAGCRMDPPGSIWDLGGLQIAEQDLDGVLPDTILFGGAALSGGLPVGASQVMAQMSFTTDVGEDEVKTLCIDSTIVGQSGAFVFVNSVGGAFTPVVGWAEGGICYPVNELPNACPEFVSAPTTLSVDHCGQGTAQFTADDDEDNAIAWGVASNSGAGVAVIDQSGLLTYTPAGADVGSAVVVEVFITDAFHDAAGCEFAPINITVTNNAPTIDCGLAYNPIGQENTVVKTDILGSDVDDCDGLVYAKVSGPGDVNPSTGVYTWTTTTLDADQQFDIVVSVFDGYVTAECTFEVDVLSSEPYEVRIDKLHDVYQGHYVDLPIRLVKGSEAMGGFDFLLAYDNSLLTFTGASLGTYFEDCGWEYFTYRYGSHGNCGNGCPSGEIRLVGLAETNNGPYHPDFDCIANGSAGTPEEIIANLTFFVTTDVNANDMFAKVSFLWMDCGDNTISVASGDTLAISRDVFNYFGSGGVDSWILADPSYAGFPGMYGAPEVCEVFTDKGAPVRFLDLYNGGIDIIDKDDIDDRGDLNMNGIPNEIADAVMFTNYFIYGESAFGDHVAGSIAASDINADGTPLTVADLVYLTRVIIGDALPYATKPAPGTLFEAQVQGDIVTMNTPIDAGAALFVFNVDGTVGTPTVDNNMDVVYNVEGNELRVLVYNIGSEAITNGTVLDLNVNGSVTLVEVEAATFEGAVMETSTRVLPTSFTVAQNYPNPFNPTTTMSFGLSVASAWNIDIYNIAGQKVNSFNGFNEAGQVNVTWDSKDANGSAVASGIYFYKISAGANSATMKMVLLK